MTQNVLITTPLDASRVQPIPSVAAIRSEVLEVAQFAEAIASSEDDPRTKAARHLLARTGAEEMLLETIVMMAYRYAYQLEGRPTSEAMNLHFEDMVTLIYDWSEHCGEWQSPLFFREPTDLMRVLETAVARLTLRNAPDGTVFPSRQVSRLANLEDRDALNRLEEVGVHSQPYPVSLGELESMAPGDQDYWYGQWWIYGDFRPWLFAQPGFIPTGPECDAVAHYVPPLAVRGKTSTGAPSTRVGS